jgi:DNA-binding MarR family transcriptional regulator
VPEPDSSATLAELHHLSARLLQVAERARADFAAVVGDVGLTPLQARTVLLLEQPTAMRALADHLVCDASNVTGLADRLEELGVLERVPGRDRRVKLLQLTPRGTALRAEVAERVASGSTVAARLDSAEREHLSALLDKLLA